MGVAGLLKALSDVQREVHISELRGLRVGLDAYCFLHRGKYSCANDILCGRTVDGFLGPILDAVRALRAVDAEPVLVFDGGRLPAKRGVEESRRDGRALARWRAAAELRAGGKHPDAAKLLAAGVEVVPEMAAACIREVRAMGVFCVVAPCEADAQLAYLALSGRIDICMTEDVDLLAFGCPRVIFGFGVHEGLGREIRLADVPTSRGLAPYRFSLEALVDLCVLSGCDYLPSLPRMGLHKASKLLHRSAGDVARALVLARRSGIPVPSEYARQFNEAKLVFSCQVVFNHEKGCLQHLQPLPQSEELPPAGYLGPRHDAKTACAVAAGEVHPVTLLPFGDGPLITASGLRLELLQEGSSPRGGRVIQALVDEGMPAAQLHEPGQPPQRLLTCLRDGTEIGLACYRRGDAGTVFWQMEASGSLQSRPAAASRSDWRAALAAWLNRHGRLLAAGEEDRLGELTGAAPEQGSLSFPVGQPAAGTWGQVDREAATRNAIQAETERVAEAAQAAVALEKASAIGIATAEAVIVAAGGTKAPPKEQDTASVQPCVHVATGHDWPAQASSGHRGQQSPLLQPSPAPQPRKRWQRLSEGAQAHLPLEASTAMESSQEEGPESPVFEISRNLDLSPARPQESSQEEEPESPLFKVSKFQRLLEDSAEASALSRGQFRSPRPADLQEPSCVRPRRLQSDGAREETAVTSVDLHDHSKEESIRREQWERIYEQALETKPAGFQVPCRVECESGPTASTGQTTMPRAHQFLQAIALREFQPPRERPADSPSTIPPPRQRSTEVGYSAIPGVLPSFALPGMALPFEALPCEALPCEALPCEELPSIALPSHFALPGDELPGGILPESVRAALVSLHGSLDEPAAKEMMEKVKWNLALGNPRASCSSIVPCDPEPAPSTTQTLERTPLLALPASALRAFQSPRQRVVKTSPAASAASGAADHMRIVSAATPSPGGAPQFRPPRQRCSTEASPPAAAPASAPKRRRLGCRTLT